MECVNKNQNNYNAFLKFFNVCTLKFLKDDCVLGLFAVKCKYLQNFLYKGRRSPECEFAEHIRKEVDSEKIMEIDQLHLECCFADDLRILRI